jgi:hypothetical protein
LFLNDELVAVTDIAVDAKFVPTPEELGLCAHWQS